MWAWLLACGHLGSPSSGLDPEPARPNAMARGWYLKAAVSESRGDLAAAERSAAWVERLDEGPWVHVHRGDFLRRQGRHGEAKEAYQRALGLRPDLIEARLGVGLCLTAEGDSSAEEWLADLLPMFPCQIAFAGPDALRAEGRLLCRVD